MHAILSATINAILAQAIALEAQEQAISQVLGILGCGGATGVRFCGGGTSNPFIVADMPSDPVAIGEMDAALASVGISLGSEITAPGRTYPDRHYDGIPATLTEDDRIGVTVLLRLVPAVSRAA